MRALERMGVPHYLTGSLALARVVRLELERDDPFSTVNVASAEDTVISKLRCYRLGNEVSDRQWRDIVGVLAAQRGRLDLASVRTRCKRLGLEDLFDRALTASLH